ncbi:nitroreductase family protein, partial [Staphylococcus aureus]
MGLFKKDKKAMTFDKAMEERRSIYNLKDSISISDDELESMIAHAVKHGPSSFNSQATRIVLLINDNNKKY